MSIKLIPFNNKLLNSCYVDPDSYLPYWVLKLVNDEKMDKYSDLFNPDIEFTYDLSSESRLNNFALSIIDVKKATEKIKIPRSNQDIDDFITNKPLVRLLKNKTIFTMGDLAEVGFYKLSNNFGSIGLIKVLGLINDICKIKDFDIDRSDVDYEVSVNNINTAVKEQKIPLNLLSINDPRFVDLKKNIIINQDKEEIFDDSLHSTLISFASQITEKRISQLLDDIYKIYKGIDAKSLNQQMEDIFITHMKNNKKNYKNSADYIRFPLLKKRLGINASEEKPYTLEEVGKLADVTRERIRQIEKKLLTALEYSDEALFVPKLEEVNKLFRKNLYKDIKTISYELEKNGYGRWNIDKLIGCLDLFKIENNYVINKDILCAASDIKSINNIIKVAEKMIAQNGLIEINHLIQAISKSMTVEKNSIAIIMKERFTEISNGWFWTETKSNLLENLAQRIANFSKEFVVQDLRDGHRKYSRWRGPGFDSDSRRSGFIGFITPPSSVLLELFNNHFKNFEISENNIICLKLDNSYLDKDGTADLEILNYFRARNFETATPSELRKYFVTENNLGLNSLNVYMSYKPYLKRYARNVWGVVGYPPSELSLNNTQARVQKNPSIKTEWVTTKNNINEIKYKLKIVSSVSSLSFNIGKDFNDIIGKDLFDIYHDGEIYCQLKNSAGFLYGSGKYLNNVLFCELGDYVAIYLDTENQRARIEVISEGEYDE